MLSRKALLLREYVAVGARMVFAASEEVLRTWRQPDTLPTEEVALVREEPHCAIDQVVIDMRRRCSGEGVDRVQEW